MSEGYVIEVTRIGIQKKTDHVFGLMVVKDNGAEVCRFSTLERGVKFTNLKVGDYEMHHSKKNTHRKVQCLRPTNKYISTVLIHDAFNDDANELQGCIAPFTTGGEAHYTGSAKAMETLWQKIGGFDESFQSKITLRILSNVPGEKRTSTEWLAQREAMWKKAHTK